MKLVEIMSERVLLYPLPHKIKGFVCSDCNGAETYVLNARLTHEANRATLIHELKHVANGDLYSECDVNEIETLRHK